MKKKPDCFFESDSEPNSYQGLLTFEASFICFIYFFVLIATEKGLLFFFRTFIFKFFDTTEGQRVTGAVAASRCSGGKDEHISRPLTCSNINSGIRTGSGPQPNNSYSTSLQNSSHKWVPPSSVKRDALTPEERNNVIFRKVRG